MTTTNNTSATTSSSSAPIKVVSRRVWKAFEASLPSKKSSTVLQNSSKTKPKVDDKPWPKNVRIAGYVAGGIFIPYVTTWWIATNPTARNWLQPHFPNLFEHLRTHFGTLEWDALSYADQLEQDMSAGGESSLTVYYQFPNEWPYRVRQVQAQIDAMNQSMIKAHVYVLSLLDGYSNNNNNNVVGMEMQEITKQVPASTPATQEALANLVGIEESSPSEPSILVVDFEEDDNESSSSSSLSETLPEEDNYDEKKKKSSSSLVQPLLQETHTYSSWYYIPDLPRQEPATSAKQREAEMEELRLEYNIGELERLLQDPKCTRDRDDMTSELRQAKRDLSRLRWKRRLRLL